MPFLSNDHNKKDNPGYKLILATASIVILPLLTTPTAANEGEAAFKARCERCHGSRDIQSWGRQRPDVEPRRAWLDTVLRRHYPPPEAERAIIIDHIQATITRPAAPR